MAYPILVLLQVREFVYLSLEENKVLLALQKEIDDNVAAQFNRPVSDRFTPHITIAKKRKTTEKLFIQKEKFEPN